MITNIYSIEDRLQGHVKRFEANSHELAFRDFMEGFRNHPFRKDMKLWCVAKVDSKNGVIEPIPHELICGDLTGGSEHGENSN